MLTKQGILLLLLHFVTLLVIVIWKFGAGLLENNIPSTVRDGLFSFQNRSLSFVENNNNNGLASNPNIAGYFFQAPNMMDIARVDLDQQDLIQALSFNSFLDAQAIYEKGGHSGSVATIQLDSPLQRDMPALSFVVATTVSGTETRASLWHDTLAGATTLDIAYPIVVNTTSQEDIPPNCRVGGSLVPEMEGCLATNGIVTIGGLLTLSYTYDPLVDNYNLQTLQGFTTGTESDKIFQTCPTCPLPTYQIFINYYGDFSYADELIKAALAGTQTTNLGRDNTDFGNLGLDGRAEFIERATVYLNVWMFVAGLMEFAIETCLQGGSLDTVLYWDEAVAIYTGSLEGGDGSGNGLLLYQLADDLCVDFGTCSSANSSSSSNGDGGGISTSKVNKVIIDKFQTGQSKLGGYDCQGANEDKDRIVSLMTIPLLQGTFLYASKPIKDEQERDVAALYSFAAAILPLVYKCDNTGAGIVFDTVNIVDSASIKPSIAIANIRDVLEKNYECLGLSCDDVGNLDGAMLCASEDESSSSSTSTSTQSTNKDGDNKGKNGNNKSGSYSPTLDCFSSYYMTLFGMLIL